MKHRSRRKKRRKEKAILNPKGCTKTSIGICQKHFSNPIDQQMLEIVGMSGIAKGINQVKELQTKLISFKDFILASEQQGKEILVYMRIATESNDANLVVRLFEQKLSSNTEIEFKQKLILEGINNFCGILEDPVFSFMGGIICEQEIASIKESWDTIIKLASEMDRDHAKTILMAKEYFEIQEIEMQADLSEQFTVPAGVVLS